jgi:nucleotide-binding universal stress UspA family protein
MYKKILVPLDGSKLAECALPHAESLALNYKSTLVLLSVISPAAIVGRAPADMELFQRTMDTRRDEAESYLKRVAGEFSEKKIKTETYVGIEPVVSEIVNAAETHDADLVVIASHGRSGLERVFFGSVASGVLNRIERPLMVIRPSDR